MAEEPNENLIQSIFDLFLAGTETTATTLCWALLYMVVYPDVQEKVQKELDAVLGSSNEVCYMDRKRLPYTNAVIHEIQRFSNIILIALPRKTVKDTELLGYPIPKVNLLISSSLKSVLSADEKRPSKTKKNSSTENLGNLKLFLCHKFLN
uniref:Uncharacterized protein n=1 Tax=Cairina moschata TaxID=8855 RepID=A0A8C3B9X7_CAIMO